MRVIITGGSGLIGRALTRSLTNDRHEVIILSRNPARVKAVPDGVQVVGWDGRTANGWGHLVETADAVVNLAGENIAAGRWTDERKRRIRDSRVQAGQAVTQAIQSASRKPAVLVQASAVGYYGPHGDEPVPEDTPPADDFLGRVCVEWESSTAPVEAAGVRRVVIRTGVVLSQEDGALPRMLLPFKLFAGGPIGSGRQGFPWIHIHDETAAIRFLIDHPSASGPFNLAAPNPVSNAEFSRALGRVLKRPAFMPTPGFALKLMFGEMASILLTGQYAVPRRLLELGFAFRFTEAGQALQDLLK